MPSQLRVQYLMYALNETAGFLGFSAEQIQDIAAGHLLNKPLEVDTKVANALWEPRPSILGPAGLQGRRQRLDCSRLAVGRAHFLGGGLKDSDSLLGRCPHALLGKADASALASLLSTVDGLDTPLEVDTKIANALLVLPPRPSSQRTGRSVTALRGPRPTQRCWPHTPRTYIWGLLSLVRWPTATTR